MAVNYEIKSNLAKLLATESIIVENRKVETACFNVNTRVLTLPMWEKATDNIYTMLVLHEISHALWTPNTDYSKEESVPHSFMNIVEDVRVEKLCKKKYPGSPKSFFNGYKELNELDFFCIKGKDLSKLCLADRINIYFKVGNFVDVKFSEEEQKIVDEVYNCETFDDCIKVSKKLYEYSKKNNHKQKNEDVEEILVENEGGIKIPDCFDTIDEIESNNLEEEDEVEEGQNDESPKSGNGNGEDEEEEDDEDEEEEDDDEYYDDEEPQLETVDNLENSIKDLIDNTAIVSRYIEIPDVDLDHIIVDNHVIHEYILRNDKKINAEANRGFVDSEFNKFKTKAQKEVNYLVKEFERLKSADLYLRTQVSKTGVLNTSKLHSYKFTEDLFKKVNIIPSGKNHGLIFILDWSGSMDTVIFNTCKQLFNLIWFCKKVNIPFDVYAFTNEWYRKDNSVDISDIDNKTYGKNKHEEKNNVFCIDSKFHLMNLFTSKVSNSVLNSQMLNIWRILNNYRNMPYKMQLSGTPLNESIVSLHKIIPIFKKNNNLQKVHCVILTDGESSGLGCYSEKEYKVDNEIKTKLVSSYYYCPAYLRDRKLGTTYSLNTNSFFTDTLLENLKDNFPDTSIIGIRLIQNRYAREFIRKYKGYNDQNHKEYLKVVNDWEKLKTFNILNSGYDSYFGISSVNLDKDSEFEVEDNAKVSKIKSAFAQSFKNKKMNKKILNEFIKLIV